MDAYEATKIVFSRIQSLDPENAAKIMGILLIQDHGEKEMIRLAFGPETLVHSVVLKARKELGLVPTSSPATPSATAAGGPPSPFLLGRQNSSSRLLGGLAVSSPTSWAPPPVFSRSSSVNNVNGAGDDIQSPDELVSPSNPTVASPFYGSGDLINELQLQDQLSFLNDAASGVQVSSPSPVYSLQIGPKGGDFFYPDVAGECRSPSGGGEGMLLPYSMGGGGGWGANGAHHRRSFSVADACLGSEAAAAGFGWRPCLYYARGYCKNGASCRFLHGVPDDTAVASMSAAGGGKMDPVVEQQCQELLLRSKSQRLGGASQLMASAFPYSPTGSLPASPSASIKCTNFLLQPQSESQRAAAAAALMLGGGDETQRFMGRSRLERTDFAAMSNPGSRQIYLTFPADSTFREEDVSNYFSIYGPVQDVRIPYQQKRMFGFVTFVYPETVRLILAKGNPHFVCDARVLVKPYKEKGKVPDKKQQQQQAERGDFSGCSTPTGLDSRDPFELSQLGPRMLYSYSGGGNQETILRRKLEEQQQAAELQQAIELQGRRFMGLQLLDLPSRNHISSTTIAATATATTTTTTTISTPTIITAPTDGKISNNKEEATSQDKSPSSGAPVAEQQPPVCSPHRVARQPAVNAAADKEESAGEPSPNEDSCFQESLDHNLPDSPFASPTKASFAGNSFSNASSTELDLVAASLPQNNSSNHLLTSTLFPATSTLDMASFNTCFFQMPRFPSGHGAVGL